MSKTKPEDLEFFVITGQHISCNGKNYTCLESEFIPGSSPLKAANNLIEKGWTVVGETVLCPDCSKRNKGCF